MQAETFQQFRPNCALSPIHRALLDARSAALRVTRICKRADEESPASTADSVAMASVRKEWRAQLAAELRELYDETSAETVLTTPPAPAMAKVYPTPGRLLSAAMRGERGASCTVPSAAGPRGFSSLQGEGCPCVGPLGHKEACEGAAERR
jgi:hypothetical protein